MCEYIKLYNYLYIYITCLIVRKKMDTAFELNLISRCNSTGYHGMRIQLKRKELKSMIMKPD